MMLPRFSKLGATLALGLCAALPAFGQEKSAWRTECSASSREGPLRCQAMHRVVTEGNQVLFDVTVATRQGQTGSQLTIRAPLGFHLPGGITVSLDKTEWVALEIQRCTTDGCIARLDMQPSDLAKLSDAETVELTFQPQSETNATVPVPTNGLFDSIQLITD